MSAELNDNKLSDDDSRHRRDPARLEANRCRGTVLQGEAGSWDEKRGENRSMHKETPWTTV